MFGENGASDLDGVPNIFAFVTGPLQCASIYLLRSSDTPFIALLIPKFCGFVVLGCGLAKALVYIVSFGEVLPIKLPSL